MEYFVKVLVLLQRRCSRSGSKSIKWREFTYVWGSRFRWSTVIDQYPSFGYFLEYLAHFDVAKLCLPLAKMYMMSLLLVLLVVMALIQYLFQQQSSLLIHLILKVLKWLPHSYSNCCKDFVFYRRFRIVIRSSCVYNCLL